MQNSDIDLVRHAFLQAAHELGQELRRAQDAGSALDDRVHGARGPARRSSRRSTIRRPRRRTTGFRSGPESDGALFLGTCKIIIDENLYDADFCKQFTDMPILVRTDTLQYLDPRDVIKDYKPSGSVRSAIREGAGIKRSDYRERLGDFMVWDTAKNQAVPLDREQVGWHYDEGRDRSGAGRARTGSSCWMATKWT